jgi:hypothetical protein
VSLRLAFTELFCVAELQSALGDDAAVPACQLRALGNQHLILRQKQRCTYAHNEQ